jgi:tRNA A37 threonylcarbamoyladenosine biosynthesis protein TsaE
MTYLGLYEKLNPVDSARYDSREAPLPCLKGTRTKVLNRLREWAYSSSPELSVFWLSGTAGTGKTTIAKTFCDDVAREGFMISSFFISRQDKARQDLCNIVRSLAYDLAIYDWFRAQAIWKELISNPHLLSLSIPVQVARLLSKPSGLEHNDDSPIIIIIDALDESTEKDDGHGQEERLVPLLVSALKHQSVKILVTSRNEQYISNYMSGIHHDSLQLHDIEKSDASKDMRSFYETGFRQLVASRGLELVDWPSPEVLDILVERTGYLFVYAATIMTFVRDDREDPVRQLESILNYQRATTEEDTGVFDQLDNLYTHIILAVVMRKGTVDHRRRDRIKLLVGIIAVLQRPLPFLSIVTIIMAHNKNYSKHALRTDLEALSSVIPIPPTDVDPVQIFHPSFHEFIQDQNRCRHHNLHVSSSDTHLKVAIACLRLMNEYLGEDMESPYADVTGSLHYACVHWTSHVTSVPVTSFLVDELQKFCQTHLVLWIEMLTRLPSAAYEGLLRVSLWCQVCRFDFSSFISSDDPQKNHGEIADTLIPSLLNDAIRLSNAYHFVLYDKLCPVDSAQYDSIYAPPGCLEGTRMTVLNRLRDWALSPSPPFSVFWLTGTLGTGKTSIAKTFCDQMALEGVLGASFFISRQDQDRRDPYSIVRTLVYNLALRDESRMRSLCYDLVTTSELTSLHINERARRLIARTPPLQQINGCSTVVVIDALDEAMETDDDHDSKEHLLSLLVSALKLQAVKIFVSSRNEQYISNYMDGIDHDARRKHHMEKSDVSEDVRSFYETRFRQLVALRGLELADWPSRKVLDILVERTGHLFVYAATVMAFVSDAREDPGPVQRLESILHYRREPIGEDNSVFDQLDKLYTQIILAAVMQKGVVNPARRDRLKLLVGIIIALQRPLPFPSIVTMMETHDKKHSEHALRAVLEALSPVIPLPKTDGGPVQIIHPSFPEFITDHNRCRDHDLHVSSCDAHLGVALACLRLMNSELRHDNWGIRDFTDAKSGMADHQERPDRDVPLTEQLRYACVYWISHVVSVSASPTLMEELQQFCENHLFQWIDELILLQNHSAAYDSLPLLLEWCRVSSD